MNGSADRMVTLGRVLGPWGVKGWIKVLSFTDPLENIVDFPTWVLDLGGDRQVVELEDGRAQGNQVVAKLASSPDREAAQALSGAQILVARASLAPCADGEYYWADLEGLRVVTQAGADLGVVERLFGTGSNDVMVVRGGRERLIPFIEEQVVKDVDLAAGHIVVDWDPEF